LDAEQAAIAKEGIFHRAIHEQSHVRRVVAEQLAKTISSEFGQQNWPRGIQDECRLDKTVAWHLQRGWVVAEAHVLHRGIEATATPNYR
jgi:hypothetical protein